MNQLDKYKVWTPRILSIAFVLFLMVFSLDVFEPGLSAREIATGLFMHNIPALILLAVVVISWKREIVGGIVFIIVGILFTVRMAATMITNQFEWIGLSQLIIAGPAFLIGVLFIVNWLKKRNNHNDASADKL
jgi:hypothetical protein